MTPCHMNFDLCPVLPGDAVLHQCIRPLIGACAPGPHGYQRRTKNSTPAEKAVRRTGAALTASIRKIVTFEPRVSARHSGAPGNQYNLSDSRPVFEVVESAGGLYIGARRNTENDYYYWRITQWVMPFFTMIPPRGSCRATSP